MESYHTNGIRLVYYSNTKYEGDDCLGRQRKLDYTSKTDAGFLPTETLHICAADYPHIPDGAGVLVDQSNLISRSIPTTTKTCVSYIFVAATGGYQLCIGDGCELFQAS